MRVYYSIGLTESALEFWWQISKRGGGALLIRCNILMLVSQNHHCTIFPRIFCLMFLIDAIKPNEERNSKLFFTRLFRVGESLAYSFVSFCFRFFGGNKTFFKRNEKSSSNNFGC